MRLRTYVDGRPAWSDNEPARARVAGYGGTLATHAITHIAVKPRTTPGPRVSYERCGALVARLGLPCGRRVGHGNWHRSAEGIAADVARRRGRR